MNQIGRAATEGSTQKLVVQLNGGQGMSLFHNVREYTLLDLQAAVYHKLVLEDGSTLYVNDFGIRSVHVAPEGSRTPSLY